MPGFLGKGQAEWRRLRGRLFRRAPEGPRAPEPPAAAQAPAPEPEPATETERSTPADSLRWLNADDTVEIGGAFVRGPCYVGRPAPDAGPTPHAHLALVEPAADAPEDGRRDLKAGRATGYARLAADEQHEYLQWCAHGRPATAPREAHALIHVYALEYRGLQEIASRGLPTEGTVDPRMREVRDELERFAPGNRPWTSAARHALAAMRVAAADDPTAWRLRNESEDEPPLDVIWWLGSRLRDVGRLNARDAYLWLHANGLGRAAGAGAGEFKVRARFRDAYRRRLPEGWRPAAPLARIGEFAYHAVSGVFMTRLDGRLEGLPDVRASALLDDAERILRTVAVNETTPAAETHTAATTRAPGDAPAAFALDHERILALQSETAEAESILSRFFGDAENEGRTTP